MLNQTLSPPSPWPARVPNCNISMIIDKFDCHNPKKRKQKPFRLWEFQAKNKKKSLFHFLWSARESFFSTTHTLFSWTNFDLPIASCPIILWQSSNAPLRTNLECRTIHNTNLKSPKFGYWKIKNRVNLWNPPAIYNPHCGLKCRCGQGDFAILVEKPRRLSWRRAKLLKYLVCCVQDRKR